MVFNIKKLTIFTVTKKIYFTKILDYYIELFPLINAWFEICTEIHKITLHGTHLSTNKTIYKYIRLNSRLSKQIAFH